MRKKVKKFINSLSDTPAYFAEPIVEEYVPTPPPEETVDSTSTPVTSGKTRKKQLRAKIKGQINKQNPSALAEIYKLNERIFSVLLDEVPNVENSFVYRLELLLNGKPFEDVDSTVQKMFAAQQDFYEGEIEKIEEELASISEEEREQQSEHYYYVLGLTKEKNIENLLPKDKMLLQEICEKIRKDSNRIFGDDFFTVENFSDIQTIVGLGLEKPRYIVLEEDLQDYKQKLAKSKEDSQSRYCLAINRDVLFNNFDKVDSLLRQIAKKGKTIQIVIDDNRAANPSKYDRTPYSFTPKEVAKLCSLKTRLDVFNHGGRCDYQDLFFSEFYPQAFMPFDPARLWTFHDVFAANETINSTADKNKRLNLSPFEKILLTHFEVSQLDYRSPLAAQTDDWKQLESKHPGLIGKLKLDEEKMDVRSELSRTILSAEDKSPRLQDGLPVGFVCSGFSSYAKAKIDAFQDPNITCNIAGVILYSKKTNKMIGAHSVLHVALKDEKYVINDNFIWDPTWSSSGRGFATCLFPIQDYKTFNGNDMYVKIDLDERRVLKTVAPDKTSPDSLFFGQTQLETKKPISWGMYHNGLGNLVKAAQEHPDYQYTWPEFDTTPNNFIDAQMTKSIHNLKHFNPVSAENAFYAEIRKGISERENKYPNWQSPGKFYKYCQDVHVRTN